MKDNERTGEGLCLDMCLLIAPWVFFGWMIAWGIWFGPNAEPPWPVGDEALYEAGIMFQGHCHPIGL